jgi:hypothetical protein
MPGTLVITTLSDGTNSTSATNCIQGSARAWVNFDGTTSPGTIRNSFNVTSVTKNGTGDYTVNFTNTMPNANYFSSILGVQSSADGSMVANSILARTTSSIRFGTGYPRSLGGSSTAYDVSECGVAIFSS